MSSSSSPLAAITYPRDYRPENDREMDRLIERTHKVQGLSDSLATMRKLADELRQRGACDVFDQAARLLPMVDEMCEQTRGLLSLVDVLGRTAERYRPPRAEGCAAPIRMRRRSPSPPPRRNGRRSLSPGARQNDSRRHASVAPRAAPQSSSSNKRRDMDAPESAAKRVATDPLAKESCW